MSLPEERMHILKMIESGQVKAEEGAQLLAALDESSSRERPRHGSRAPVLRVRVTDLANRRQKINVTLPVGLIDVGIKLGARLFPRGGGPTVAEIRQAVDGGYTGRIFDMQDLEEGERVEIFID
ncbi:MAG TPA: hypothetical protein VFX76_22040 [Roseiflexaceae bacterium]|nr:hypothetical protein [Roseiflexaceae bacterium]